MVLRTVYTVPHKDMTHSHTTHARSGMGTTQQDDIMAAIEATAGRERKTHRAVTFGEALLRLEVPGQERLERTPSFAVRPAGPELNVAAGLVALGVPAAWVSTLADVPSARIITRAAGAAGVDLSRLRWAPSGHSRVGISYVEHAPSPRPSRVLYDAGGTAMVKLRPGTFDWAAILDGASVLHLSGSTLGLSAGVCAEALEAIQEARRLGVLVGFDLVYREDQWGEAEARQAFMRIVPEVDVLFASRGTLATFFGIEGAYEVVLQQAIEKLGVAAATVSRKRAKGSRRMTLESMAMGKNGTFAVSGKMDVEVADRLGAGDAFVAGFLAGYLENPLGLTRAVSLGAAASALKLTMPGEFLCATRADVEALISNGD